MEYIYDPFERDMRFSINKQEYFVVFQLQESKLTSLNTPNVKTELVLLSNEGFKNIIIDLSDVEFVDSSGLSALLVANRLCSESNGSLVITGLNANVNKLIQISQLDKVLHIIPTLEESIDFIKMEELTRQITQEGE